MHTYVYIYIYIYIDYKWKLLKYLDNSDRQNENVRQTSATIMKVDFNIPLTFRSHIEQGSRGYFDCNVKNLFVFLHKLKLPDHSNEGTETNYFIKTVCRTLCL